MNWPSREEWARMRRTFYFDQDMHPCPATRSDGRGDRDRDRRVKGSDLRGAAS